MADVSQVPVSDSIQEQFKIVADVIPVMARGEDGEETGIQQTDDRGDYATGYPMWQVKVVVSDPIAGRKSKDMWVKVPSVTEPELLGKKPVFGGLQARSWSMMSFNGEANGGMSFTATSVAAGEDKPSTKKATSSNGKTEATATT